MYFNGGIHGWNDSKLGYIAPEKTTRIYCDECAETEIPLPKTGPYGDRVGRHFDTGFRWAPHYGGSTPCTKCGKHV
jgi:hypothetical protein